MVIYPTLVDALETIGRAYNLGVQLVGLVCDFVQARILRIQFLARSRSQCLEPLRNIMNFIQVVVYNRMSLI